ncbi:putative immunity protein [Deinococcus saxicola]|uniref:putative immunity protein n=1 Tax=Deinococcus saxicola TaxID=249406 RepID=UPI0039EEEED6
MKPDSREHVLLALWAADCAAHVLEAFEARHPQDDRPRKAIEAARAWAHDDLSMAEARAAAFASHAAAREVSDSAAIAAARAAGHAAATAHVVTHAPHAARYALAAVSDRDAEREWQRQQLPERLWAFAFG